MKLLKSLSMALTLALALSPSAQSGNIQDIKGTWNLLKPEFRAQLSPVCGALGIEFKYIEKLYHFGNPDDATVQLIKQLFHAVPGGFMPSKQNIPSKFFSIGTIGSLLNALELYKNSSYEELHKKLYFALINDPDFGYQRYLDLKEQCIQKPGDLKNKAFQIINKKLKIGYNVLKRLSLADIIQTLQESEKTVIEPMQIDAKVQESDNAQGGSKRKRSENNDGSRATKRLKKETGPEINTENLIHQLQPYAEQEVLAKKFESFECKNIKQKIDEFISLFIRACNESTLSQASSSSSSSSASPAIPKIMTSIYRPFTAHHALLCWIYKKMDKKEDLFPFFANLDEAFFIDKSIISRDGWKDDRYLNHEEGVIHDAFQQEFNNKTGQEIFDICSGDKCADIIFYETKQQLYGKKIPVLPEWQTIFYEKQSFADCIETTIRNLCNILTYDQATAQFGKQTEAFPLSEKLITFYQTPAHSAESQTDTMGVREAWSNLVQNLPNISYVRIKQLQGNSYICCPDSCHGFIRLQGISIPENTPRVKVTLKSKYSDFNVTLERIFVNNSSYIIVPEDDNYHLYEMQASTQNIIMMMNHLFGFNLFKDQQELSAHFFSPSFNARYFTILCQKCGWTVNKDEIKKLNLSHQENKQKLVITTESIDKYFELNIDPFKHAFTHRPHQVTEPEGYRKKLKEYLDATLETSFHPTTSMLFDLYPATLKKTECVYRYAVKNIFLNSSKDLIAYFIIKNKTATATLVSLLSQIIKSLETADMQIYQNIAEYLSKSSDFFSKHKNNDQLREALNILIKQATECEDEEAKLKILLSLCPILIFYNKQDIVINAAKEFSRDKEQKIKNLALKIYLKLVEKNTEFEEAKKVALENIKKDTWRTCGIALKIITTLIKKNAIPSEEAEMCAKKGLSFDQSQIKNNALDLLIELIKKGFSFDTTTNTVTKTIFDTDKNIFKKTLKTFNELFKKRHGFGEAFTIIAEHIDAQDEKIKENIKQLFSIFMQYPDGIWIILKNIRQSDEEAKKKALVLLSCAADSGYALEEITAFLGQGSLDNSTRRLVEEIRKKIIGKAI